MNIEERIRLVRYRLFNVNTDWEIAPFLDLGAVARDLLDVTAKNFVANPGVGFRAVVRPNVVGRVDIGFGKEGPAIFATLGYPFSTYGISTDEHLIIEAPRGIIPEQGPHLRRARDSDGA